MTVTIETKFSETGQHEPWKNDVAKELNILLEVADETPTTCAFRAAALSIVQRVADMEEIHVLKGEECQS